MSKARFTGVLCLLALVAALVAANFYVLGPLRTSIIQREESQIRYFLGHQARLQESLLRTTELILENAQIKIGRDGIGDDEIHAILKQVADNSSMTRVIGITDSTGQVIHSSRSIPAPDVNLSDRDYVGYWLAGGVGQQFVSGPIRNVVDNRWMVGFSKPIRRDGQLTGVIVSVIEVDYLSPVLQVSEGTGDYATLLDRQYRMIARYPERPEDVGKQLDGVDLFSALRASRENQVSGVFNDRVTGEARIAGALKFYDGNLVLASSRPLATALGYWSPLAFIIASVSVLLVVAASVALYSTLRQLAIKERESQGLMALNRQLQDRTLEAERLATAKSEFLAVMSHEIRTPLTAVMGMIDLAVESEDLAIIKGNLTVARRSSRTLLAIINDILDMSRLDSGRIELESIPFGVATILEQSAATVRSMADDKGLSLTVVIADDVPRAFLGDPNRLVQILLNLAGNAIKFTEHGSVTIRAALVQTSGRQHRIRFDVADTGPGIPEDQQDSLFKPFEQLAASRARKFGGSGLGLSICKGLVEAMGGSIGVESLPGLGSRFWFELDLTDSPAECADLREDLTGVPHGRALRVLVVDDNPINRDLISAMLENRGHDVLTAASGQECITCVQQGTFDVVLLDIQMPEMDGVDTIRELRRLGLTDGLSVIAVTANSFKGQVEEYISEGFDSHVSKPIDWSELLLRMSECTGSRQAALDGTAATTLAEAGQHHCLDTEHLRSLIAVLGLPRTQEMVQRALSEIHRSMEELDRDPPLEVVKETLHALKGVSGNFGLSAIYLVTDRQPDSRPDAGHSAVVELRPATVAVEAEIDRMWGTDWRRHAC